MQTPVRCKRAMTFPERMRYGGGSQDVAVPLRLAHYPLVITCFRRFLGAHWSEGAYSRGGSPPPRVSRRVRKQKPRRVQ